MPDKPTNRMALAMTDESNPSGIDYARYFLYNDPTWPWQTLLPNHPASRQA